MEEIKVVCAADNNYTIPLTVTLSSLLSNLKQGQPIILYVIDGGIKQWNKVKIERSLRKVNNNFKLEWLNSNFYRSKIENLKVQRHFTEAAFYRLLIPYFLPKSTNKVIYLDSDTLIVEDLTKLWNVDLQDKYLFAVQSITVPYVSSPRGLMKYQEWGLKEDDKYFNSGVLVINLDKWRTDNISEQAINFTQENRDSIRGADQDSLNAILAGKWCELDPRWNQTFMIHTYSSWQESRFTEEVYNNILNDPYIIHFTSHIKPWHFKVSFKYPNEDLFFEYLDRTAWTGWRPKESLKKKLNRYWKKLLSKFNNKK